MTGPDPFTAFVNVLDDGKLDTRIDDVIRRAIDRQKFVRRQNSMVKATIFKAGDRAITKGMKSYLNGHKVIIKEVKQTRALIAWENYDLYRSAAIRVGGKVDMREAIVPLDCLEPLPTTPVSSR